MSEVQFNRLRAGLPSKFQQTLDIIKIHSEAAIADAAYCNFTDALKEFGGVASALSINQATFKAEYNMGFGTQVSVPVLIHGILEELAENMTMNFVYECKCNGEHFIKSASPTHYSENEEVNGK